MKQIASASEKNKDEKVSFRVKLAGIGKLLENRSVAEQRDLRLVLTLCSPLSSFSFLHVAFLAKKKKF